jgi:hypothetical protein
MKMKILGIFVSTLLIISVLPGVINAEEQSYVNEKIESIVFSEPDIIKGDQFLTLNIDEATSNLMRPGKPILPVYTKIFKFPFNTKIKGVECKLLKINQKVLSGEIQPSPEPVPLNNVNIVDEKKVFENFIVKDNTVYDSMDYFPDVWYNYRVGCGLDGSHRVIFLAVQFYPIQYSPGQNMIRYVNMVDIIVEYTEPTHPVFYPDEYDLVIITPSEYSEKLQPLVEYKSDSGIAAKLVTLDEIYDGTYFTVQGRDDQEKIKYFIKDAIEGWDITYVLFAGGANKVPIRWSYVNDNWEIHLMSDLYYADIYDGSGDFCSWDSNENDFFGEYNYQDRTDFVDLYPDVSLGRLNFRSIDEVSDVVSKIITYESTGAYMEDWFSNFVVVGGDTFPDSGNCDEGEYLNEHAIDMMDGFTPEKIWATNGKLQFAINIDNAVEKGSGFLYMTGHGTPSTWATHPHNDFETWWPITSYNCNRVENLKNGEKLPVVFIGGCSNLRFSGDDCFGWSYVKNPDGGGIACYGNSALGWGYPGFGCVSGLTGGMELSNFKAYGDQNAKTTGELWSKALNNYLNDFGVWSVHGYKTVEEWQSFSDPSLRIRKVSDKPNTPDKPEGPITGEIGVEHTYTIRTTDPDGDMIKYCVDWGDDTVIWTEWQQSGVTISLNHTWEIPGDYVIKVKVRDEYGLDSEWSEPLLVTMVSPSAFFDIVKIRGGIGQASAVIKNIGSLDASLVNCSISVVGGMLGLINALAEETLDTLAVDEEKKITIDKIFGLGKINVTVTANTPSANTATKTANGFVVGPFVFVRL